MDKNTTHPNAYRVEAAEKRVLAAQYAAEANELERQAKELEGPKAPAEVEAVVVEEEKTDKSKNPFNKK